MRDDIRLLLMEEKYKAAALKCKKLIEEEPNNPDIWYSLFLADNKNYIDTNFDFLNNEEAYNTALENSRRSEKWKYIFEFNLYKNFTKIKEVSLLFRYNQMNDSDKFFDLLDTLTPDICELNNVNLEEFYDGLDFVISSNINEVSYDINILLVNILYLKTNHELCLNLLNDLISKGKSYGFSLSITHLNVDFNEVIELIKLLQTKIYKPVKEEQINEEHFINRIEMLLAEEDYEEALNVSNDFIAYFPDNQISYIYLLLSELRLSKVEDLNDCKINYENNETYLNALKHCDNLMRNKLENYCKNNTSKIDYEIKKKNKIKKNKIRRKLFVLIFIPMFILSLLFALSITGIGPFAHYFKTNINIEDCSVDIVDEGLIITKYFGNDKHINIPEYIDYQGIEYKVIGLGESAFESTDIESIKLPNSINRIEKLVFHNCSELTYVDLPDELTYIGFSAFGNTHLKKIEIPNSVEEIERAAFSNCNYLEDVNIPSKIKEIKDSAFWGVPFKKLIIPKGVTSIGYGSFAFAEIKELYIPNTVVYIASNAFYNFEKLEKLYIPDSVLYVGSDILGEANNVTVYVEHELKPDGWTDDWNTYFRPVEWGISIK